jgi:putative FmdB family regulatory protein
MPIFAYRCDSCGFEKDVLQKRSDPPLDTCPSCSSETFSKRLTAPAFQLKGSGWYVTDFRDNGKAKAKPGESGDAAGADSSAPADAKTAALADGAAAKSGEKASTAPAAAPASASPATGSQSQTG